MKKLFFTLFLILYHAGVCFAVGGDGATCNPSTANWGSCELVAVPWAESVTNTINVDGGSWESPYTANQANTKYVLQSNATADGGGFFVSADYITIDLNGFTLTYNESESGEGIGVVEYGVDHLSIVNGSIVQSTTNLGKITSVSIVDGGSGYQVDDVVTLDHDSTDATLTVTGVDGLGAITSVTILTAGKGYEVSADFRDRNGYDGTVIGGSGTGAEIWVSGTISEGDIYGRGNNPIWGGSNSVGGARGVVNLFVANLYINYSGRDLCGVVNGSNYGLFEQNTIEDEYQFGTLKNRDHGTQSLVGNKGASDATGNIARNNTILDCRQGGIVMGGAGQIYGNYITMRSIATNSTGINGGSDNTVIYNNTIIGRGEHPIGIGWGTDTKIYNNSINVQTTALGEEYGATAACFDPETPCGNYAVGYRTTWGGDGIKFFNNEITVTTNSSYSGTYSPTGESVIVNGKGRGLFLGIETGESSTFADNEIIVLDEDGTGKAFGASVNYGDNEGLFLVRNTVTSNIYNVVLGDEYGPSSGYPMLQGNTLIKSGSYEAYKTYTNGLGGYFATTARIVDSVYSGGAAADSYELYPNGGDLVSVYFGEKTETGFGYSYQLHDNNDTSATLIQTDYDPLETLSLNDPDTCAESPLACVNESECQSNWNGYEWVGGVCQPASESTPTPRFSGMTFRGMGQGGD